MKLAILTSNHLRHHYFANVLAQNFNVTKVFQEEKVRDPSTKGIMTKWDDAVKEYFNERTKSESKFFGQHKTLQYVDPIHIVSVDPGKINNEDILDQLKGSGVEYIAVFGSSILKEEIIEMFPEKIINMHLGLSPYYRGSGTNFWPLYDEKPEYVGVTIHYLDKGIDTGALIVQGVPEITKTDTPHSIGNKTIMEGVRLMVQVFKKIEQGNEIIGVPQVHSVGTLRLFKDCTPEHIVELSQKFKNGLIGDYIDRCIKGVVTPACIVDKIHIR